VQRAVLSGILVFLGADFAYGQITIVPTYDTFINANPTIVNSLNAAIGQYTSTYTTSSPVTIRLSFRNTSSGLGSSLTEAIQVSYTTYRSALLSHATSADDLSMLAFLPNQTNSPTNGSANVVMSLANARVLGLVGASGSNDSSISLNFSIMNWDRVTIDPNKFDLKAVAQHEIDEALGTISGVRDGVPWNADHTRFASPGVFSFTTNSTAKPYFSVDGGVTNLVNYNQNGTGDFGDFEISGHVQDWAGTRGATPNLSVELRLLDIVGYTFAPVPEPSSAALVVLALLSAAGWRTIRRRAVTTTAHSSSLT